MKHLFKPKVFRQITVFMMLLLAVKLAWFVVALVWLPS
ncbi:MAG: hypothetical protein QG564_632, partial [Campylobacterota bacterium]|nr:hypothetical protein [Campylobacterota bacterium]